MSDAGRIQLGRIVGAHGLRGEVVVHAFTGAAEDIAAYGPLMDAAGSRTVTLAVVRVTDKGVIARVAGVADRTAAEALKGTELWVARDRLPPPAEEEFYHADLVGLAAVAPDGTPLGTVVAVQNFGAGDLLEVRLAGARRTELVPFEKAFVPEIDLAARRVTIALPGLAEEPEDSPEDDAAGGKPAD